MGKFRQGFWGILWKRGAGVDLPLSPSGDKVRVGERRLEIAGKRRSIPENNKSTEGEIRGVGTQSYFFPGAAPGVAGVCVAANFSFQ
jgi:hypothetical protein